MYLNNDLIRIEIIVVILLALHFYSQFPILINLLFLIQS